MTVADVIGWMGAVAVVLTYAHAARGGMRAAHHVGNALGGAGLAVGAIARGTWSSVAENGVWLALALYGLARARRSDRRAVLAWPRSLMARRPARAHRRRPLPRPVLAPLGGLVAVVRFSRPARSSRRRRRRRTPARAWLDAHPVAAPRVLDGPSGLAEAAQGVGENWRYSVSSTRDSGPSVGMTSK
jgi:hypothetical protein